MEDFFTAVMATIRKTVETQFKGNISRASQAWGVTGDNLNKWLNGTRSPTLEKISPILNQIGAYLACSNESGRNVCFVNAKIAPAVEGALPPEAEDYMAAPLVGEVGAGPGYIPQEEIKSWFLVYRNLPAVRYRRNLIAVEIGDHSDSMQPTLNPRDIVLVDRDDRDIQRPGHMMLVLDPDGAGMIKRVAVQDLEDGDSRITFYSDNAMKHPPQVYSLRRDYMGEWEKIIVGRVIWAWADVREK